MKIFNTKSNKIEEFKPIEEGKVSMYVCGPTVYNYAHIGNARPIVVFDTLYKLLEELGYKVTYVSNYTDVDDRIIEKAIEEKTSELEVADRYIEAYEEVRTLLNASNPDFMPRVTNTMDKIIGFIQRLIEDGSAYQKGGDVYFAVDSVKDYGRLSHQNIDELKVGARIQENVDKNSPLDFALWKETKEGIKWDSPWGQGRPGWHTECVVMIHDVFERTTIDIHGGGQDLKFPHHENENAQNCALHDVSLANYWMHNAMVDIDNQKMSKSLGNVILAKDMVDDLGSNVSRWLLIQNHYRQTISITDEVIAQSQKEVGKIEKALKQAALMLQLEGIDQFNVNKELMSSFLKEMSDDLNTPNAIKELFESIKLLNQESRQSKKNVKLLSDLVGSIERMAWILGLEFDLILSGPQIQMVKDWNQAKVDKDYELADELREKLMAEKIL